MSADNINRDKIKKLRSGAISLELDIEEDDKVVKMVSRESGLFCVTKKKILRYRSPDKLDPELNHESVPWEQSIVLPLGSRNYIVARTVMQTTNILKIFFPNENSEKYKLLSDISWEVMSSLVSLSFIKDRLEKQIDEITSLISDNLELYTQGASPKPLPAVEYYDIEFRSFVNEVKRCLDTISELFPALTELEFGSKHNSFKGTFGQGHFHKAESWASETYGDDHILTKMLNGDQGWIGTWIAIRIAIEHPKEDKFVETLNFSLEADRNVRLPTWRLVHEDYKDMNKPQNLLDIFEMCINNLLKFYEDIQIILLDGHLPETTKIILEEIPVENRDSEMPIRYKTSVTLGDIMLKKTIK